MALGDAGDEVSSSSSSPPLLLLFRDAGGAWRVGGDCRARRKMTLRWRRFSPFSAAGVAVLCLCAVGFVAPALGQRSAVAQLPATGKGKSKARYLRHADPVLRRDLDEGEREEQGGGSGRRRTEDEVGGDSGGENEATVSALAGREPSLGGGLCSPLHITGLESCSDWRGENVVSGLLGTKREMLRRVVRVLEDPESSGPGGDPDRPLLLVQELAVDETDAAVGSGSPVYVGKATDAGGWSPELGGMNRWLERYYREVLDSARPVLIHVHGDDTCALENEISRSAREAAVAAEAERLPGNANTDEGIKTHDPLGDEDYDIPLAIMTLGWDPAGDPTRSGQGMGRDVTCALRILDLPRVGVWFTSHTHADSHQHPKLRYVPIGFGGWYTRNGLEQSVYLDNARRRLKIMEECDFSMIGRYDLLFECNTLERRPRARIWQDMTENEENLIPVNHCPLPPSKMVDAAATGIFAVSPPGTAPDCFRHYEMMVEGNIALVPDEDSLRTFMTGLPAFFLGKELPWGSLTCDRLVEMASEVQEALRTEGEGGLDYKKLTHGYWRNYIRETVLKTAELAVDSPYPERSAEPLDPPGWDTYRSVGCFQRKKGNEEVLWAEGKEFWTSSCASFCKESEGASKGGTGFFGVTTKQKCWCGLDIGGVIADDLCSNPVTCGSHEHGGCIPHGKERSKVYVFGPPDKPLDHMYHGCYSEHSRYLYHMQAKFEDALTPELCGSFCASFRYPFFGVERSSWCRCGVMTRYAGTSLRAQVRADEAYPHLELGDADATTAALPAPGAVVGDKNFACTYTCAGDSKMRGCGGDRTWDLYSFTSPCVLFRDCDEDKGVVNEGT